MQLLINPSSSQEENASWKQDVPLPRNQRLTLWLDQGWLKAARLNERNELLWAVVVMRWNPKEDLRIEHQGAGINVYGPNNALILRNSLNDLYSPMVLRCNHTSIVPDNVLIDPATFGLRHFAPLGSTDDGRSLTESDSSEWIYIGAGPTGSKRVQSLVRLLPRKLHRGNLGVMAGTDGIRATAGDYQLYDENGFLFIEQMSEPFAKHQVAPLETLLNKKAPPLSIQSWLNIHSPLALDSLQGSVVLVYFWAVWCPPCVGHLASVQALARDLKNDPFRVITIHTLSSSNRLDDFLKYHDFSLPIGVDSGKTFERYTQNAVPLYVLIDKKGFIRSASDDAPSDAIIKKLLRE